MKIQRNTNENDSFQDNIKVHAQCLTKKRGAAIFLQSVLRIEGFEKSLNRKNKVAEINSRTRDNLLGRLLDRIQWKFLYPNFTRTA